METDTNLEHFRNIASGIADKHHADIKAMAARLGSRPPFDDLMTHLKQMEQELTTQGVQFAEGHKDAEGHISALLTDGLRIIIRATIEDFIKSL